MEVDLCEGSEDVAIMDVKTEAVEEKPTALVLGSPETHAPCGDDAGGAVDPTDQTAEKTADPKPAVPLLLYPVSTERYFTTSGDGKTFREIAPATPSAPQTLPCGTDFSSKAVRCLIKAVGRRWSLYETRERSQLFQSVQEEMASQGHVLPAEKIRRKWNNLIVTYKRAKDRSRESGGKYKPAWEFFDLMDATLGDTVGAQVISITKRTRGTNTVSAPQPVPSVKITTVPQIPPPTATMLRHGGDFGSAIVMELPVKRTVGGSAAASSVTTSSVVPNPTTKAPDVKPLIVLKSDIIATCVPSASVVPPASFITSPRLAEKSSPLLGSTGNTGVKVPRPLSFILSNTSLNGKRNFIGISTTLPSTSSSLTSSTSTPSGAAEGRSQRGKEEEPLWQEFLRRQDDRASLERVARRRTEAREKRREKREVRQAESLGRMATALELLSSKQDTVIALLQRLADRK